MGTGHGSGSLCVLSTQEGHTWKEISVCTHTATGQPWDLFHMPCMVTALDSTVWVCVCRGGLSVYSLGDSVPSSASRQPHAPSILLWQR